ncbi:phage tail assembly chaperone [Weissella tructae]
MANVQDFIDALDGERETKVVKASPKLPPITIQALTGTEFEQARKAGVSRRNGKGGKQEQYTDEGKIQDRMIELAVISPDLNSKELQDALGTPGEPAGTLRAMLKAGILANSYGSNSRLGWL